MDSKNAHTSLSTSYPLPFPVRLQPPPLLGTGATVLVSVELPGPPSDEAALTLRSVVTPFIVLAETGALGGHVPPWKSGIGSADGPAVAGATMRWTFNGCTLDEGAVLPLVNLLTFVTHRVPIRGVTISQSGNGQAYKVLGHAPVLDDPYPPRWASPAFRLQESEEDARNTRLVEIDFEAALSDDQVEDVEAALLTWAGVTMNGAYAVEPEPPLVAQCIPDPFVTVIENNLTWSIDKWRAHPAAWDGLVNVCAALHHTVAPIRSLSID